MSEKQNQIIEHYLHRIKEEVYNLASVDNFISTLRHDLYEYEESHPDFTEEDLETKFGQPDEIAKDFLEESNATQPKKIAKSKKWRDLIIGILIVALIGLGIYLFDLHQHQQVMATDVIVIHD